MATRPIFKAARGLNNAIEAHRLTYDSETGACDLAEAVNVIIDDSGSVSRRKGVQNHFEDPAHSLWSHGDYCFFVSNGRLMRYIKNGSIVTVHPSVGDIPMFFEWFQSHVWANNGLFRAILKDLTISSWDFLFQAEAGDTRTMGLPDSFTRIAAHAGRMFAVSGNLLYESEPGNARAFSLSDLPLVFESDIIDMISVGQTGKSQRGLFVSTREAVHFLSGTSRANFIKQEVLSEPVAPGTMTRCPLSEISSNGADGTGAMWVCHSGVFQGLPDGSVKNTTTGRLVLSKPVSGAAAILPGQYFFSLEVE
ncbi:hypothetical protein LLG39_08865 [bacterium]|nr:hypothetical protein [bacterium]